MAGKIATKGSFYDRNEKLYVDCAECTRGGKGVDTDKCSAGHKIKKVGQGGCYSGTVLDYIDVLKPATAAK